MTRTYTIYSSNGFIGFCLIYGNQQFTQGTLYLFETVTIGNQTMMYQQASKHQLYPSSTIEIDIIRDLMYQVVPSLRTNGLTYSAFNNTGKSESI
jgi:hypothetical protein